MGGGIADFENRGAPPRFLELEWGVEAEMLTDPLDAGFICPYDERQLLDLFRRPAGILRTDEDRKIRYLMDKYYVPPELTLLGKQRRESAAALVAESKVLAASLKKAEAFYEA